ncbi:sugar phosphate isomerase/epimerase family protein [Paenibacillus piri]|uniref:Sugar phosphate isomerase/epimerase n=1 Tax=Paenibacillus piri TaxID=2547395 RepID=A0A4R5KV28_9BACL|nr:sugar phosphate isomerase/epimerase [Paenibacillus piri]TDF98800.1 sugar phosphate isomerase/epimerase [Paenibacillus piri]
MDNLQIGFSCHSRNYGPGTPDEIFGFIQKLGYAYIDVDSVSTIGQAEVIDNPERQAEVVRELCEKYELRPAEYFLGTVLADGEKLETSQPDLRKRERMLESFERVCRFAGLAGFRSIMGSAGILIAEEGFDRSFEHAAETLGKMTAIAADHGVAFHVEPSQHSLLNVPAKAVEMAQRVQGLRYTLDFLHYQVHGYDQRETMKLLPYTGHMHARQAAVGWGKCPFEYGEIDYDAIVKRLRGLRWNGVIAMEFWSGPAETAAGIHAVEQTILMRYHLKGLVKKYYR